MLLKVKLAEVKSEFEGVVSKFKMMLLEKDRIELEMKNSNHVRGIRAQGMEWSPNSVKRAVETTAIHVKDMCQIAQRNGLLNIEGVFEHMVHNHNQVEICKVCRHLWRRQCQGNSFEREGASKCQEISIQVELLFLDTENRPAKDKQDFNIQFVLSCSAGWVSHPTHLDLMYTNRHFLASVDPTGLTSGAHRAYITPHNATNPARGKTVPRSL